MSGTKRARISSVSRIRQGAPGVVCSPGSSPSRSQRRIVRGRDAELGGGLLDRDELAGRVGRRGGGDAGALARVLRTRASVNGRPVPVRWPWRVRIAAIWRSG